MSVTAKVVNGAVQYYNAQGNPITATQARTLVSARADAVAETNRRAIAAKARAALTTNATYLAIASPTAAQNTAQVRALTREANALIRLVVKALDTTTGT